MGLDSFIFKVKAPTADQMRRVKYCTWDNIKEKLGLSALAVDDFKNVSEELKELKPYTKPAVLSRQVLDFDSYCEDHSINQSMICGFHHTFEGLTILLRNDEEIEGRLITNDVLKSYEKEIQQQVLLFNEQEVQYWRKNYRVQDYFYEHYNVDNCKYVEISREDLKYIRDRIDAYTSVPKLAEDEHLFYYEWY